MDKERLKALRESVNKATLDGSAKAYQEGLTRGANTARNIIGDEVLKAMSPSLAKELGIL